MDSCTQYPGDGNVVSDSLIDQIAGYIGTTVTIYTASGGESGSGFTGVLSMITPFFVRLITCVGPAPCCPLGSRRSPAYPFLYAERRRTGGRYGYTRGNRSVSFSNVGSITDIPLDKIVAFVHNAV
jgi:hypothetical protein